MFVTLFALDSVSRTYHSCLSTWAEYPDIQQAICKSDVLAYFIGVKTGMIKIN